MHTCNRTHILTVDSFTQYIYSEDFSAIIIKLGKLFPHFKRCIVFKKFPFITYIYYTIIICVRMCEHVRMHSQM